MVLNALIWSNPAAMTMERVLLSMRRPILSCLTLLAAVSWPSQSRAVVEIPDDASSAVILAYHGVGEDALPDSSLGAALFTAHIQEISDGSYTVMPLPAIINALKNGDPLPRRTLAITFEGAHKSAYTNAMPLLLEKNIPFTVFFSSGQADGSSDQHMNWNEIRSLSKYNNVSFGILPDSYAHIINSPREEILAQINTARVKFRRELSAEPAFFSYPFGEISTNLKDIVREQGFAAGFGLQSGCASASSDLMSLPRFTMTDAYGDLERFRLVASALPLPAQDIEPADLQLVTENPVIGFSVPRQLAKNIQNLSCFVSGQPGPGLQILGENRVEIRLAEPISEERTRVNCTMPGPEASNDPQSGWRWFGMLLVNKNIGEPAYKGGFNPEEAVLQ